MDMVILYCTLLDFEMLYVRANIQHLKVEKRLFAINFYI